MRGDEFILMPALWIRQLLWSICTRKSAPYADTIPYTYLHVTHWHQKQGKNLGLEPAGLMKVGLRQYTILLLYYYNSMSCNYVGVSVNVLLLKFYVFFNRAIMSFFCVVSHR
jgi:hypothetical protein